MRKNLFNCGLLLTSFLMFGYTVKDRKAEDPVSFKYEVKKLSANLFEVKIIAKIEKPWHIYSQHTPPEGISLPTNISFVKNPLIEVVGKPEERGNLITKHEEELGTDLKYFANQVEFVQKVELKGSAKTNLMGSIEYMACTDEQCLQPVTEKFKVALND